MLLNSHLVDMIFTPLGGHDSQSGFLGIYLEMILTYYVKSYLGLE